MKKAAIVFSILGLVASSAVAQAADYNWNGLYAGANLGWGWENRDATIKNIGSGASLASGNTSDSGILGGGQVGYNYALPHSWVVGVEADIDGADLGNSRTGGAAFGQRENDVNAFGTARARLGYGVGQFLVYGTGGFAWANESMTRTQQFGTVGSATPGTKETDTDTGAGWTAGGGVEWGFAQNLSAKLEYLHLDLGDQSFVFPAAGQRIDANSSFDVVRVGLNYRFD